MSPPVGIIAPSQFSPPTKPRQARGSGARLVLGDDLRAELAGEQLVVRLDPVVDVGVRRGGRPRRGRSPLPGRPPARWRWPARARRVRRGGFGATGACPAGPRARSRRPGARRVPDGSARARCRTRRRTRRRHRLDAEVGPEHDDQGLAQHVLAAAPDRSCPRAPVLAIASSSTPSCTSATCAFWQSRIQVKRRLLLTSSSTSGHRRRTSVTVSRAPVDAAGGSGGWLEPSIVSSVLPPDGPGSPRRPPRLRVRSGRRRVVVALQRRELGAYGLGRGRRTGPVLGVRPRRAATRRQPPRRAAPDPAGRARAQGRGPPRRPGPRPGDESLDGRGGSARLGAGRSLRARRDVGAADHVEAALDAVEPRVQPAVVDVGRRAAAPART